MKTYFVKIVEDNGQRYLTIDGFILSNDLAKVKKKLGDINKLPLNKKITVKI